MTLKDTRAKRRKFDLTAIIDRTYKANATRDPRELAAIIMPKIPQSAYKGIVETVLPAIVRQRVGSLRRTAMKQPKGKGKETRSKRAELAASVDRTLFMAGVYVRGDWIQLGDMTALDTLAKAAEYRDQAAPLLSYADAFTDLTSLIQQEEAEVVRDLDEDEVRDIFAGMIDELFEQEAAA